MERIHRKFRSGMLESAYETFLARTLVREGFDVERQKAISFEFEGDRYENACRVDLPPEQSPPLRVNRLPAVQ
ncbi:GxxExxY protein [Gemmatimonas sp.]|uniref:GxxExxY protein n=1 Tax=Gemmatimonas sp. TaxID=1962908 RepID=UPI003983D402